MFVDYLLCRVVSVKYNCQKHKYDCAAQNNFVIVVGNINCFHELRKTFAHDVNIIQIVILSYVQLGRYNKGMPYQV